ncbi:MAG: hypothetical protein FHK80_16490 [Azoarcus sp. PHD]|nr:MAG: hypothetical protein FHK80_16490 [Azoarcus sp. PHD]
MGRLLLIMALWCSALLGNASHAQDQTLYGGCVDAKGRMVVAAPDPTLPSAVSTRIEGGRPVIRYNHAAIPRLDERGQLFLFAHECARLNLGLPASAQRTPADARRADCWAASTLLRSGLIRTEDLGLLQETLDFSAEEWSRLPGPIRRIDLRSCPRHLSPSLHVPGPGQDDWNTCTRRCADASLSCQGGVAGRSDSGCDAAYSRCVALCNSSFPR